MPQPFLPPPGATILGTQPTCSSRPPADRAPRKSGSGSIRGGERFVTRGARAVRMTRNFSLDRRTECARRCPTEPGRYLGEVRFCTMARIVSLPAIRVAGWKHSAVSVSKHEAGQVLPALTERDRVGFLGAGFKGNGRTCEHGPLGPDSPDRLLPSRTNGRRTRTSTVALPMRSGGAFAPGAVRRHVLSRLDWQSNASPARLVVWPQVLPENP